MCDEPVAEPLDLDIQKHFDDDVSEDRWLEFKDK